MSQSANIKLTLIANDLVIFPAEGETPQELLDRLKGTGWRGRAVIDTRRKSVRVQPIDYPQVRELLGQWYMVDVQFDPRPSLPHPVTVKMVPRPYQEEALRAWEGSGCRGVVVLPTGAGKTLVAMLAMTVANTTTLICVPTLDLLGQWRTALLNNSDLTDKEVGSWGGGATRSYAP